MHHLKIAARIRRQRLIIGFSQENMAQELNISVRTYSKIERGETVLSVNRLIEIAVVLGVQPGLLFQDIV